jgi:hypothetical protein
MGSLSKMINASALILMVSACATTNLQIPDKYALDKQLERMKEIQDYRTMGRMQPAFTSFTEPGEDPLEVMNRRDSVTLSESSHQWIKVDNQSLILRTGPSEYHLLVLQIPAPHLIFSEDISFISPTNVIRAGLDLVQLGDNMNYVIDRIYKINGHEQMYAIKNQLMEKNKE